MLTLRMVSKREFSGEELEIGESAPVTPAIAIRDVMAEICAMGVIGDADGDKVQVNDFKLETFAHLFQQPRFLRAIESVGHPRQVVRPVAEAIQSMDSEDALIALALVLRNEEFQGAMRKPVIRGWEDPMTCVSGFMMDTVLSLDPDHRLRAFKAIMSNAAFQESMSYDTHIVYKDISKAVHSMPEKNREEAYAIASQFPGFQDAEKEYAKKQIRRLADFIADNCLRLEGDLVRIQDHFRPAGDTYIPRLDI